MATAPINYLAMFPQQDFLRDIQGGLQLGAGLRQIQDQREEAERKRLAQEQYQQDAAAAMANPTPQAWATLAVKYPQHREAFKQGWETLSTDQQQNELRDMTTLAATLKANRPDVAIKRIDERIASMKNSGQPVDQLQFLRDQVETNPTQAYGSVLQVLAGVPGGDKALTSLGSAAKAPAELAKAEAEATKAGAEAEVAPARQRVELAKLGADLGLTQAQTAKTLKDTEKLSADLQKSALELATGGGIDPEKRFKFEGDLRKEYSDQTKGFQETREAYERIKASQDNAVGDLSLIFAYMKMLDPGSVVREGEFATAEKAAGVPERILNIYNKTLAGERLSSGQRETFKGQAKSLLDAAQKREKTVRAGIDNVIKSYRLNPDNVFFEVGEAPPKPAPGAPAGSPAIPNKYQGRAWTRY